MNHCDRFMVYLSVQMEEVAEIVGAQISRDALRPVPSGGVRLDLNAIDSAARGVLQGHVHPAKQLSGLVQAGLYCRHHVVPGGGQLRDCVSY